eukprot:6980417-Heterocapsa_arctica.AAC.1
MDFKAERAKFLSRPIHFDPTPHLGVFHAASYVEPRLLVRSSPSPQTVPVMRQRGEIDELV